MLICEYDQLPDRLEIPVELGAQPLLKLVRLAALLGLRTDERLNREEIDFHLTVIVHRRPHCRCCEIVRSDNYRLEAHRPKQTLGMTRGEIVLGLLEDCPPWSDNDEVAHSVCTD